MMNKILAYLFVTFAFAIQANSQVNWTKYPGNPVFPRGTSGNWDSQLALNPFVMYNSNIYQMWFSGYDGGSSGAKTGYAYSIDGINWTRHTNPVLQGGAPGSWDAVTTFQPCVIYEDTIYKMWYCGHDGSLDNRQIGFATGSDSIHWSKYGGNPVLTPGPNGSWDDLYVESPEVLLIDSIYHMWYSGNDGTYSQIGHATSADGINWTKDTHNPVLQVGTQGSWDEITVAQPCVVFDGTIYHMWYSGGALEGWDWKTGYAYSLDGMNWIKVSVNNPVLGLGDPGSWDDTFAGMCSVILDENESTFKMWYGGGNGIVVGDIGYATAPLKPLEIPSFENTWYKYLYPVFEGKPGEFDSNNAQHPSIVVNDNQYHMWYSGYGGGDGSRVGYAVSDDGITWESTHKPVLQTGSGDDWDNYSVQGTSVLYDGSTWHMWYTGLKDGDLSTTHIGYATSTDKINWTKYENNPVLGPGANGKWDQLWVGWPEVLFIDGIYHMWYTGRDGSLNRIGHATSTDGISWEKDPMNPVLTVGTTGAWDDINVWNPDVYYDGYSFHMWYCGARTAYGDWKIGYAVSLDGRNWEKISIENPVMDVGSAGQWDEKFVGAGVEIIVEIMEEDTLLKMWYGGGNANVGKIGYAATDTSAFTPVGVEDNKLNVIPTEFSISQNYPNPFNPTTKIRYKIPTTGLVTLQVYNLLGEVVTTLVNEEKPSGTYEVEFNSHSGEVRNLSSGVYFYKLQAGNFVETKKMILLK